MRHKALTFQLPDGSTEVVMLDGISTFKINKERDELVIEYKDGKQEKVTGMVADSVGKWLASMCEGPTVAIGAGDIEAL